MGRSRWGHQAGVAGIMLLIGLAGCEGLQDPPPKRSLISQESPELPPEEQPAPPEDLKPHQAPLPALPKGAGPIDPDAPEELVPTESGLYYRILRKSEGKKPSARSTVLAHYRGTLDNGTQFDSSYDRDKPTEFGLGGVIMGWREGLQLIGEGGMIELEIPSDLAYGPRGMPPTIPPKATLHFLIELKQVVR